MSSLLLTALMLVVGFACLFGLCELAARRFRKVRQERRDSQGQP